MNKQTQKKMQMQMMRCGNSAHEVKNILSQIMNDQIPELIILNDQASRIEGLSQDIIRQNLNFKYLSYFECWKIILTKLKRHVKMSLRIIDTIEKDSYNVFTKDVEEKIINHLKLEKELIDNVDSYLNKLFIEFADQSQNKYFEYSDSFNNDLYNEVDFEQLNNKQFQSKNIQSISNLIQIAQDACNSAHNIQNYVCPYQIKPDFQESANNIINNTNEIENQFRSIQGHLKMYDQSNFQELKNNLINMNNYAQTKLQPINEHLKVIEKDQQFEHSKNIQNICKLIENTCNYFTSEQLTRQIVEST